LDKVNPEMITGEKKRREGMPRRAGPEPETDYPGPMNPGRGIGVLLFRERGEDRRATHPRDMGRTVRHPFKRQIPDETGARQVKRTLKRSNGVSRDGTELTFLRERGVLARHTEGGDLRKV